MATLEDVRRKFPQYARYNDEALAAAVWNQHYKDKLPFEEFSRRIGYRTGQIPREAPPAMPEDPTKTDLISDAGSLFDRIMANVQAVPALGGIATGITALSRLPGATRLTRTLGQIAEPLVPRTGRELARQTTTAAALAPVGFAAEQLAEPTARAIGETLPLPQVRSEAGQAQLAEALRTPLGITGEVLGARGLISGTAAAQRRLAQRPAGVPEERLQAARKLKEQGGKLPASQLLRGADVSRNMEVFNKRYNALVGNPESTTFGTNEFRNALTRLKADYDTLLSGKTVTFDDQFFNDISKLLDEQRSLASTGVMFAESRPIINTLSQIRQLPADLQARINALRDVPETTTDIGVTQNALRIIDDALGFLSTNKIQMDAPVYNQLRSQLGSAAYRTADPDRGRVLRSMQKAFDDAADRSLPEDTVQGLKTTRNRWENLKILEEAQKKSEPGLILPQAVGQVVRGRYDQGIIYGDKEIYDIGKEGISLGIRPSGPSTDTDAVQMLPTQVGGYRQKASIAERGLRAITEPIKAKAVMEGPRAPEEVARREAFQETRAASQGIEDIMQEDKTVEFQKER